MYRSILVPLDGSTFGEQALPYALAIAERSGARLLLVHAHEPAYMEAMIDTQLDEELREQARRYLAAQARRLARRGARVSTRLLIGPPGHWICEAIDDAHPDLIVMTTHGRGGLDRWWLGSVTDTVLRHAHVPILAVRPKRGGRAELRAPRIRRILVPLDGSDLAEAVLGPVDRLAWVSDARIDLLSVVMPPFAVGSPYLAYSIHLDEARLAEHVEGAEHYLDDVARRLRGRGHRDGSAEVHVSAEVAPTILRHAAEHEADVIAIATHGRGGLRRLLLGSTADKVIRAARVPVLVYRPSA